MKNHLAFSHYDWWGVIGDQTCWKCCDYHPLWKIGQCDGYYSAGPHRAALHCKHREFMDHIMEDFEIVSPQELVNIVRNMKLCQNSISAFSDREEFLLREIDLMYNLPIKHKHIAAFPTRPLDLLHWRTITEILAYTRDHGAITSSTSPRKLVPLIDTRCDLIREYELHFLTFLPAFFFLFFIFPTLFCIWLIFSLTLHVYVFVSVCV